MVCLGFLLKHACGQASLAHEVISCSPLHSWTKSQCSELSFSILPTSQVPSQSPLLHGLQRYHTFLALQLPLGAFSQTPWISHLLCLMAPFPMDSPFTISSHYSISAMHDLVTLKLSKKKRNLLERGFPFHRFTLQCPQWLYCIGTKDRRQE